MTRRAPLSPSTARALRGYALLMVLMVLALIALGLGTVMYVVDANLTSTRRILGETRCFYAVDSASRIASATVQAVAATLPPDSTNAAVTAAIAQATQAVCDIANGGTCPTGPSGDLLPTGLMPSGVTMEQFGIRLVPTTGFRFVSTGPFRGVVIRETGMSVFISARDDGTGRECHVRDSFSTGTVSPFQFMMFATGPKASFYARNNRGAGVPVYASGDLCIGAAASATMNLARVGAGGTLNRDGGGTCAGAGGGTIQVLGVPFAAPDNNTSFQNEQPRLVVPAMNNPPNMQGSNRIPAAAAATQVPTSRWLVDPVVTSVDSGPVASVRIAGVADIVIMDGVWYVKRAGIPWPGMPVYSDHPGSWQPDPDSETAELLNDATSAIGNDKIGLDDVRTALETAGLRAGTDPWPPKKFSWYETDSLTGGALNDAGEGGVISYGALKRDASGALVPGFYPGGSSTCGLGGTSLVAVTDAACTGTAKYTALAEGARSGFGDSNADSTASPGQAEQTKIAPINFDVARFVDALSDTSIGELGSYFPPNRKFNGVIYITQTWKGQLDGLLTTAASSFASTQMPEQAPTSPNPSILGTLTGNVTAPAPTTLVLALASTVQQDQGFVLPFPLCGTGGGGTAYAPGFAISPCDPGNPLGLVAYKADHRDGARPNAVRVHSGGDISALQPILPGGGEIANKGLSIVTNLPLYVQGDFNTVRRNPSGGNFPRAMLAANTITVLSNAWDDDQNSWSDVVGAGFVPPSAAAAHSVDDSVPANPTTTTTAMMLRAAILTHWSRPGTAQSNEELIRHLETYGAATIALRGSLFVAGDSVFRNDTQETTALGRPALDFRYDPSYAQPSLQPAGIPKFMIGIAGKWKDTR